MAIVTGASHPAQPEQPTFGAPSQSSRPLPQSFNVPAAASRPLTQVLHPHTSGAPVAGLTRPTAPRAQKLSPAERITRSIELAERDHLTYRACYFGVNEAGGREFRVPSRTHADQSYLVTQDIYTGGWDCQCPAGAYGYACGHIGSAAHLQQMIEQAQTEAAQQAHARYLACAHWLERQGW